MPLMLSSIVIGLCHFRAKPSMKAFDFVIFSRESDFSLLKNLRPVLRALALGFPFLLGSLRETFTWQMEHLHVRRSDTDLQ